jgi:hypothetical protein
MNFCHIFLSLSGMVYFILWGGKNSSRTAEFITTFVPPADGYLEQASSWMKGAWNPGPPLGPDGKDQIQPGQTEKNVRPPGGQNRTEKMDVPQAFENPDPSPVNHGDEQSQSDTDQRSPFAHGKGKGNADQGHDQAGEREGDFMVKVDLIASGIETPSIHLPDVAPEFEKIHLARVLPPS